MSSSSDRLDQWNRQAACWADYVDSSIERRELLNAVLDRLGVHTSPPRKIVELGCGEGFFCRLLKTRFPEARITGLDFSENLIQIAKARGEGVDYVIADFEKPWLIPSDSKSDLVLAVFSFFEAESLANAFASVRKLLASRGKFVLVITDPLVDLIKCESGWSTDAELGHSKDGTWILTSSFMSEKHMPIGRYFRTLRPISTYIKEAARHELVVCDLKVAATVRPIQSGGTELLILGFCFADHITN